MRKILVFLGILILNASMTQTVNAALVNGGFETGNLSGWTTYGSASVVTSHTTNLSNTFLPVEGNYFLSLYAGMGTDIYTTASQFVNLNAGQTLSGWAEYDARDYYTPFLDDAYVKIGNSIVWAQNVAIVGSYGDSPWQQWSWTAPASGLYNLEFGVRNTLDNQLTPYALFDAIQSDNVIPEPATISLLGMGLLGLLRFRRKKA